MGTITNVSNRLTSQAAEQPGLGRPYANAAHRKPALWLRLLPICFFLAYLTTTVLLFAFGPWPYPVDHGTKLYLFLAAAHLALLLGYLSAVRSAGQGYNRRWPIRKLMVLSTAINLAILYPTLVLRAGASPIELLTGALNVGNAYALSAAARSSTDFPIIEYLRLILGPAIALLFPLLVFYWNSWSKRLRVLGVGCLLGNIGMYVLMGTNKLFADTVTVLPWLIAASYFAGYIKLGWSKKAAIAVVGSALFVVFLFFFTETQSTRPGVDIHTRYSSAGHVWADEQNFMIRNLSVSNKRTVLSLVSYLSHGYYAVYLSLDKPFVPMFGVGNSQFLFRQAARFTGVPEIAELPYPMRIEEDGWDAYGLWSTIYPWIASDVSFPGTLIVVFFIGRVFAQCWLDTLQGANPFAVAMFAQFLIMLYYFNANNQCLQSGEGLSAFWVLLILWRTTRRKVGGRAPAMVRA